MHTLLTRQLNRLGLREDAPPSDLKLWQKFLEGVNATYTDADQDRYMLERSMEISSREHGELNEKLEKAQHIARLGYWSYNPNTHKFSFSKELAMMLGLKMSNLTFNESYFMDFLHPKNHPYFKGWVEASAFTKKAEYEGEGRIRNAETNEYGWYYIKAQVDFPDKKGERILSGIALDITKQKEVEQEVKSLNQRLIQSARLAGMADVAISVLHNVGNILNSANVSLGILQEKIDTSSTPKLLKILTMMVAQKENLATYLTQDPKGHLIPEYLANLEPIILDDRASFITELSNLGKHLHHVKDMIARQQTISKVSEMNERIFVPEILDTALQINESLALEGEIHLVKDYDEPCFVYADKTKVLQILVNLLQNAKEAVRMTSQDHPKEIRLSVKKNLKEKKVYIHVEDTGVGILSENLSKIFSFGFTTKKNGHGFGLHGSALAAKEIGGSLIPQSKGIGKGAAFILTMPLSDNEEENNIR